VTLNSSPLEQVFKKTTTAKREIWWMVTVCLLTILFPCPFLMVHFFFSIKNNCHYCLALYRDLLKKSVGSSVMVME